MDNTGHEYKILKNVEKNPNITQRQMAKELGLSLGKTNYIIQALIQRGWVKLDNFKKSNSKIGYIYLLTPEGLSKKSKLAQNFLAMKSNEYNELKKQIEQLKEEI